MNSKQMKAEPLKTVLVITLATIVIYLNSELKWTLLIGLVIGSLGLFSNYMAIKIDYFWMKLSWLLSLIVPKILLSLIFFLFLTPLALLSRIFGKKNQLSLKNKETSLFKEYNKKFDQLYFEKPW